MGSISTNIRATLNEGINVNQGRDFSDLGAGYVVNTYGFVDDLTQLAMTPNNLGLMTLSKGCAWVSYMKTNDQAFMKCEMVNNYNLPIIDADGTYFLYIELNAAIFPTGSAIANGSDYFTIKRTPALPVSGYFCPLYQFTKAGTLITIVADLREQRDVVFRDIECRDIDARIITAEKIITDEITLPSGDLQDTLDTITGLAAGVSLQGLPVMAGESILARQPTVIEEYPLYADATTGLNVGDIAANTRRGFRVFGSQIVGGTFTFKVGKTGIPLNLVVQIENQTADNPNNTLANPSATVSIPQTSITGIIEYTVNFPSDFSITRGTVYYITFKKVGDDINPANFYTIYGTNKETTTRYAKVFNGVSWSTVASFFGYVGFNAQIPAGPFLSAVSAGPYTTTASTTLQRGFEFVLNNANPLASSFVATSLTLAPMPLTTTGLFYLYDGVTLAFIQSIPLAGGTISVNLVSGRLYRIVFGNIVGNPHNQRLNTGAVLPQSNANISLTQTVTRTNAGVWTVGGTQWWNILSISVSGYYTREQEIFENQLLCLTDMDFSYKTAFYGLSTLNYLPGLDALVYKEGEVAGFVGLITGVAYYLDTIAGGLTTTNTGICVGYAKNSTVLVLQYSYTIPLNTTNIQTVQTVPGAIPPGSSSASLISTYTYTATRSGFLYAQRVSTWERGGVAFNTDNFINITISNNVNTATGVVAQSQTLFGTPLVSSIAGSGYMNILLALGQTVTFTVNTLVQSTTGSPAAGLSRSIFSLKYINFTSI